MVGGEARLCAGDAILGGKQGALGVKHGGEIDQAALVALTRQQVGIGGGTGCGLQVRQAFAVTGSIDQSGNVQAINYFVAQKYIEAFKALAEGPNQKFVLMPMESAGVIGSLGGIAELAKEAMDRQAGGAKVIPSPKAGG